MCRDNRFSAVPEPDSNSIAAVRSRRSKFAFFGFAGLLLIVAAFSWLSYLVQGLTYGDAFGVPGNEKYLAVIGSRAIRSLVIALCSEAIGIGILSWHFSDDAKPVWRRLGLCLVLAAIADGFTFAVMGR